MISVAVKTTKVKLCRQLLRHVTFQIILHGRVGWSEAPLGDVWLSKCELSARAIRTDSIPHEAEQGYIRTWFLASRPKYRRQHEKEIFLRRKEILI